MLDLCYHGREKRGELIVAVEVGIEVAEKRSGASDVVVFLALNLGVGERILETLCWMGMWDIELPSRRSHFFGSG